MLIKYRKFLESIITCDIDAEDFADFKGYVILATVINDDFLKFEQTTISEICD
jgi:hypothetical protein